MEYEREQICGIYGICGICAARKAVARVCALLCLVEVCFCLQGKGSGTLQSDPGASQSRVRRKRCSKRQTERLSAQPWLPAAGICARMSRYKIYRGIVNLPLPVFASLPRRSGKGNTEEHD
ncbi:unnamed protein product [Symbiodinium natans]|uniref:Uncharacterized protein n=1 Tax=Symbiodinium natans TaxID=878477 RepID=A0A812J6I5_9DINO|nr:unnamed protein product [Symbiodinium natans]